MTDSVEEERTAVDSAPKEVPLDKWKWAREWAGFVFGLVASILSIYLFIQNQSLKSRNEELEADEVAMEAQNLLVGNEEAIYPPFSLVVLENAEHKINHALKLDPENPRATRLKAITHAAKGEIAVARKYAQKAVDLAPAKYESHIVYGNVLWEAEQHEEALACYERAVTLNPRSNLAFANSGDLLRELGRPEEAISKYRKAVAAKPDDFRACNNLGYTLFKQGEAQEAIKVFRDCIRENPDNALLRFNLGNALVAQEQVTEALEQYKKSLELNPNILLRNTSLIPAKNDEVQISRDAGGNWQIAIGDQRASLASDEIESLPTDERGAPKAAGFWQIDDDAI